MVASRAFLPYLTTECDDDLFNLRSMPASWVQPNERYAYFATLFSINCGLKEEARYSFDGKDFNKRSRCHRARYTTRAICRNMMPKSSR